MKVTLNKLLDILNIAIIAFLLMMLVWGIFALAVGAQSLEDVEQVAISDAVRAGQRAYYARYNRFAQGLDVAPSEPVTLTREIEAPAPADQTDALTVNLGDIRQLTWRVNVYESPAGHGYEIVYERVLPDRRVMRMIENHGPESWRDRAWYVVTEERIP